MNYFHLVHKVIILMLFTSMLKICSLVKMKVTLISPKAFFTELCTLHEKALNALSLTTQITKKIKD